MKVIFLRHGETELNKKRVAQGWTDSYMTKDGIKQIKDVANKLKDIKIDLIVSSPLGRAMRTARENVKHHQVPFLSSSFIMEYNMGSYERAYLDDKQWLELRTKFYVNDFKFPRGESQTIVQKRINRFLRFLLALKKKDKHQCVLVVTHGGIMHSLLIRGVKDKKRRQELIDMRIDNCSTLHCVLKSEKRNPVLEFIEFEHLPKKNESN